MPSSYILEQLAKHVKREGKWVEKLAGDKKPNAFVLTIAAGEKVVSSTRARTFKYIEV